MTYNNKNKQTVSKEEVSKGISKNHKLLIIVLIAIIIVSLAGHIIFRPDRNASLQIVYTGNLQGQMNYEQGLYAGYEKIAAIAHSVANDKNHVLLVDTGNEFAGNETADIDDGHSLVSLMNATGYDAMVPGILDFVNGADALSALRSEAQFPFLAANIKKADGSNAFENYKILTINSVRIGIIGVTTALDDEKAGKNSLKIEDPVASVQEAVAQLNEKKLDAVIVLAYTNNNEITQALANIEGVSLVIENSTEADLKQSSDGTMIVSSGTKGSAVGVVSLNIHRNQVKIENTFYQASLYDELESDADVVSAVYSFNDNQNNLEAQQVGSVLIAEGDERTATAQDGQVYHMSETGIGNLTTDAMRYASAGDNVQIALIRDKSIHGALSDGTVTFGDIRSLFDTDLYLVVCKMTGGEVRSLLEDSFKNYPNAENFLQVSGISYTYEPSEDFGSHLSSILVDGRALDDARTYLVAMTNQMADELAYTSESTGRMRSYKSIASVVKDYIAGKNDTVEVVIGEMLPDDEEVTTDTVTKRIHIEDED